MSLIKFKYLFSLLTLSVNASYSQTYKAFEEDKLEKVKKYQVKTITYFRSDKVDTAQIKDLKKILLEEYDENGNNIKTTSYFDNDKILSEKNCKIKKEQLSYCKETQFDENEKPVYVTETFFNDMGAPVKTLSKEDGVSVKSTLYTYENGDLVKKENRYNDTAVYILYLKYNDKHQRILDSGTTSMKGSDGKRVYMTDRKNTLEYDKHGNVIRHNLYNDKDRLSTVTKSTYDEKGNKIAVTVEMANGMVLVNQKMVYDKNNNLIEFVNSYSDGNSSTIYKSYNEKNQLIREVSQFKGSITEITEIVYTYY